MRLPLTRLRTPAQPVIGVALGAVSWPLDLVTAVVGGLLPHRRFPTTLAQWHHRYLRRWIGSPGASLDTIPSARRAVGYLLVRTPIGMLATIMLGLLCYGCVAAVAVILSWLFGLRTAIAESIASTPVQSSTVVALILPGLVLLFLNLTGIAGVATLDRIAAAHWFRPSRSEQLQRRVDELTLSRSDLVRALDSERSRIERDLHDGVQQRVVALGLMIGRARRQLDPQLAGYPLLEQAQRETADLLDDLRDVAWRVSPSTLESEGLAEAIRRLAERAALPVRVHWSAPSRLPAAVETCLFYVVSESLTNITRHAQATSAAVRVSCCSETTVRRVRLEVIDDGVGGAVPRPGHGLAGLIGRVEAADGTLTISSPAGGPTRLEAVLPCG